MGLSMLGSDDYINIRMSMQVKRYIQSYRFRPDRKISDLTIFETEVLKRTKFNLTKNILKL